MLGTCDELKRKLALPTNPTQVGFDGSAWVVLVSLSRLAQPMYTPMNSESYNIDGARWKNEEEKI